MASKQQFLWRQNNAFSMPASLFHHETEMHSHKEAGSNSGHISTGDYGPQTTTKHLNSDQELSIIRLYMPCTVADTKNSHPWEGI